MKFGRRLRYYLVGLSIGLVIVLIMFRGRGCSWLPENRVLDEIAQSEILITEKVKCEMICNHVTEISVYELFSDGNGDVYFSESDQRSTPKMYMIEDGEERYKLEVVLEDSVATISKLHMSGKDMCACDEKSDSVLLAFHIPAEKVLKILFRTDGKEIKYNETAECQMTCYGLTESDIIDFIQEPEYIRGASDPSKLPNPVHVFENTIRGSKYRMIFEDGGRRTRLTEIQNDSKSCGC